MRVRRSAANVPTTPALRGRTAGRSSSARRPSDVLRRVLVLAGFLGSLPLCGCLETDQRKPLKYLGDPEPGHYRDVLTEIDYPDARQPIAEEALNTDPPRRIRHPREEDYRDMPLQEALGLALENNPIIRDRARFLSPGNPLLQNPQLAASVFDPAIQQTGILFGNRGVEAALAEFDTQFTTRMIWGRNERIANSAFEAGSGAPGDTVRRETTSFTSQLEKQLATGGSITLNHNWNYELNNLTDLTPGTQLFDSFYRGQLQAEFRQPLLAGSGVEFTRIAGPIGQNIQGISGVSQGVVIARINADISIADFEQAVRGLLLDVEQLYWELSLAYRRYDAEVTARNAALRIWRNVQEEFQQGLVSIADEAQARENYFRARARAETALADLYSTENQFRRLVGLPVNDGGLIRPSTEPTIAEFSPDWYISLARALTERVELRRQKWEIKSLALQLQAAENLTRPRLDLVSNYRVNAFGSRLFGQNDDDAVGTGQGLHSAYETLTQGDQTGWNLGFEFSMPFGFRTAHSQVRNLELRLAKARAALSEQELEISHELAHAFQELDRWYQTAQTNWNLRQAAAERLRATQALFEAGRADVTVDLLLRAQTALANAEVEFYNSLIQYNQAVTDFFNRQGTLLEYNNVYLAEGLWDPKAYLDALRRAKARAHALDAEHLQTEPETFSFDAPPSLDLPVPAESAPPRPSPGPDSTSPLQPEPQDDEEIPRPRPPEAPSEPSEEEPVAREGRPKAASASHGRTSSQPAASP